MVVLGCYVLCRVVAPLLFSGAGEPMREILVGLFQVLAPLAALLVLVVWVVTEDKKFSRRRMLDSQSNIESLRSLSWQEFEQLVGEAYRRQGYAVTESGGGGADGGVDLVLTRDDERTLVQCKQWRTWKVGVKIVRELYGVMAAEGVAGGIAVTCGQFTGEAKVFARDKPLVLVDGPALWELVAAVKTGPAAWPPQTAAPAPATANQSTRLGGPASAPECPQCGSPMVLRVARKGPHAGTEFYGCPRYPHCRGTRQLGLPAG